VKVAAWRQARALLWVGITLVILLGIFILGGVVEIPGLPASTLNLASFAPWIYIIPILVATKALLEVLRPVFRAALRSHVDWSPRR